MDNKRSYLDAALKVLRSIVDGVPSHDDDDVFEEVVVEGR